MNWIARLVLSALVAGQLTAYSASAATGGLIEDPARPNSDWCEQRKLGTNFYCVRPKEEKGPEKPAASPPASSAADRMEKITKELRERKALAILEPTPENIESYIRFQREQLDRSSLFADQWQRLVWQDPELDYTLERPTGTLAKRLFTDARQVDRQQALVNLSSRYGLFYFFASNCGACTIFSPILKSVTDSNRITVMAVSTDGGPSDQFPKYVVDSGQRQRMGVDSRAVPAVVLFDTQTKQTVPVGYGVMSADELMERIFVLTQKEIGSDF